MRIIWLLVLVIVLAGCGAATSPATDGAAGAISFMIFGDPAEKAAYEELVASFKTQAPAITVNLVYVPSQRDYRTRLSADFAAGTPADVVLLNYRRYAAFAARGQLAPLGPYLAQSSAIKEADFYQEALAPYRWQGTLQCIPQNISSLVVYYNKNLFDAAGLAYPADDWTWDDFLRTAKALTVDADQDGVIDQYGLGTEAVIFRMAPFIWQNGGELVDNPAAPTRLTLTDPASLAAIQWFVDLQVKHRVLPNPVEELIEQQESRFVNGRMGMFLNSRRGVPSYRQITSFDWDVAPLPQHKQRANILHADAYCLAASSAHKAAAWTFIEYANSVAGQTIIARSGRTVPSLRAVAESPAFLTPGEKPARSQVFLDNIPTLRAVPVSESWVDVEGIVDQELERAFHGDVTIAEALQTAITDTSRYFSPGAATPTRN